MTMESHQQTDQLKNVDILSFDGGGSRGIMEVSILNDVMRLATIVLRDPAKLSFLLEDEDILGSITVRKKLIEELSAVSNPLHPNEVYDMIVGTSTGGFIAFGLIGGNVGEDGKRRPMTVEDCIKMYKDKTKEIFTKSWTHWFFSAIPGLSSIPITTYSQNNVKNVLKDQFQNSCLADFAGENGERKTIAGAVARQVGRNEELVLFDTETDRYKLYKTYQVLQATSNAPVYFDTPVKIGDKEFVDGGVGGNCPLAQAIPRAKEIFGDKVKITSALSIAPPHSEESHIPDRFQVQYWLNYFVEMSTNGYAVYMNAKQNNRATSFRRLAPRGESLKQFKLDETDAEKMLNAMEEEKLNTGMFLVDVIATAAVVLNTYLGKANIIRSDKTVQMGAKLANIAGEIYSKIKQPELELAYESYSTSKHLWRKSTKRDDSVVSAIAAIYYKIGELLTKQGKYKEAIVLYRKNVSYWKKRSDDNNVVKAWFSLAQCLLLSSCHEEALEEFDEVLKLQQKIAEDDETKAAVARTENRIGLCYREKGDYVTALWRYIQVLKKRKKLFESQDHADIAESMDSLCLTFSDIGKNVEAIKNAEDSLAMKQRIKSGSDSSIAKSLSDSDALIAESLDNLGWCLMENEEYERAQTYLEKARIMKKDVYRDEDHPSIAITLEHLAKCLLHVKKDDSGSALAYAQQALGMKRRCLGNVSNPAIAKSLEIVSLCLEDAGDLSGAIKYLNNSVVMLKRVLRTTDHPTLVRTTSRLRQLEKQESDKVK